MVNNLFDFKIITPENIFINAKVSSFIVPGQDGFFCVQKDHVDLIGAINSGVVSFKEKNKQWIHVFVEAGFISVTNKQSLLLVEKVYSLKDLNAEQIKSEIKQQSFQKSDECKNQLHHLKNILMSLNLIEARNKNLKN